MGSMNLFVPIIDYCIRKIANRKYWQPYHSWKGDTATELWNRHLFVILRNLCNRPRVRCLGRGISL